MNEGLFEKNKVEDILQRDGSLLWRAQGNSMYPFLRANDDAVYIQALPADPLPWEVVLYKSGDRYVLHRVLSVEGPQLRILGDNCTEVEYVPRALVLGVLAGLVRGGRPVSLDSLPQRLYLALWVRPWRLRVGVLKFLRRALPPLAKILPLPAKRALRRRLGLLPRSDQQ